MKSNRSNQNLCARLGGGEEIDDIHKLNKSTSVETAVDKYN
jgi:hypothetical protein